MCRKIQDGGEFDEPTEAETMALLEKQLQKAQKGNKIWSKILNGKFMKKKKFFK